MAALRSRWRTSPGNGRPEFITGSLTTPSFFSVMGVPPLIGRILDGKDDKSGDNVVVISYSLWQRRV